MSGARPVHTLLHDLLAPGAAPPVRAALDRIRAAVSPTDNLFDVWLRFDEEVARADVEDVEQQLVAARARFEDQVTTYLVEDIDALLARSPEEAWRLWLAHVAESIAIFRLGWAARLAAREFAFPAAERARVAALAAAVTSMRDGRWPDASAPVEYLAARPFLPPSIRARLLVLLGEISLYHAGLPETAKQRLDEAAALCAHDGRVLGALGDYWLKENHSDRAEDCFRQAIAAAPAFTFGYIGMGDVCESRQDWAAAEDWYHKAVTFAAADTSGFEKLITLYGRPDSFEQKQSSIATLVKKVIAVDPERTYTVLIQLGDVHRQNKRFDTAHEYYARARAERPSSMRDLIASGGCYEEEEQFERAANRYLDAIAAAPQSYDGYMAITTLYEKQKQWERALHWYRQFPTHSVEFTRLARSRIGDMYRELDQIDEAEAAQIEALRSDPGNDFAKFALQNLADQDYQRGGDPVRARRIYDALLQILGESYRADYHNRLGNLHYYLGDFAAAADEYGKAIDYNRHPIYHRNLAGAYRQLLRYDDAAAQFEAAYRIDENEPLFRKERALLLNSRGNDLYAAGDYDGAVAQYRSALEIDDRQAVIFSNLADALERTGAPGRKAEAIAEAVHALEQAFAISSSTEYRNGIDRLRRRSAITERYGERALGRLPVVTPIAIEVAADLIPQTEHPDGTGALAPALSRAVDLMRARIEEQFGVRIPGVRFRGNETDLPHGMYVIMLWEIPLASGTISLEKRFFDGPADRLEKFGIDSEPAGDPRGDAEGRWVDRSDWHTAERYALELWDPIDYVIHHLEHLLRQNLSDFIGHQEVLYLVQSHLPTAAAELADFPAQLSALTVACRALLAEVVPIRPFADIYETFDTLYQDGVPPVRIVEAIRSLPSIRRQLWGNRESYPIIRLGANFESFLAACIHDRDSHPVLAMDPESCQRALAAVRHAVGPVQRSALCVETSELRPFVRLLVELEFPHLPVLSRAELVPEHRLEIAELEPWSEPPPYAAVSSTPAAGTAASLPATSVVNEPTTHANDAVDITVVIHSRFLDAATRLDDQPIGQLFEMMQDGLFYDLGVLLPDVRIAINDALEPHDFDLVLNGRRIRRSGLKTDEFLVNDTVDRLRLLDIDATPAINPANGNDCAIGRGARDRQVCEQVGLTTWGPAGFLVLELSAQISRNAAAFQTTAATEFMLDVLQSAFPHLVGAARGRFTTGQIADVLRELLVDEISVRDLRSILEAQLAVTASTDVDVQRSIVFFTHAESLCPTTAPAAELTMIDYAAVVRMALKRYISHKYTRGGSTLVVYLVDPEIETLVARSRTQPLTPDELRHLHAAVHDEVGSLPATAQAPVILTSFHVRRPLRRLIARDYPLLAVVSYQELSPDMNIQPIARITWQDDTQPARRRFQSEVP